MKIWKLITLILMLLLLVACTGKAVRAIGPPPTENSEGVVDLPIVLETDGSTESLPTELLPTDQETTGIDQTEAPSEIEGTSVTDTVTNNVTDQPASTEGQAVQVIESENAYTDSEKAVLLKEIDLLLDETLKDLNSGDSVDEWDENMGGGQ